MYISGYNYYLYPPVPISVNEKKKNFISRIFPLYDKNKQKSIKITFTIHHLRLSEQNDTIPTSIGQL